MHWRCCFEFSSMLPKLTTSDRRQTDIRTHKNYVLNRLCLFKIDMTSKWTKTDEQQSSLWRRQNLALIFCKYGLFSCRRKQPQINMNCQTLNWVKNKRESLIQEIEIPAGLFAILLWCEICIYKVNHKLTARD